MKNLSGKAGDRLFQDLDKVIQDGLTTFNRIASSELVMLFWNIGKELNIFSRVVNNGESGRGRIKIVSEILSANYGTYFTEENLRNFMKFAQFFEEYKELQRCVHFLSWEHILALLKLKSYDERMFYLFLKITGGVSLKDLKRAITLNKYEDFLKGATSETQIGARLIKGSLRFQLPRMSFELLMKNDGVKPNLFKGFRNSRYQHLLKRNSKESKLGGNDVFINSIFQQVEKYRVQQNNWLNANFNLLLWNLGKRISEEIELKKTEEEKVGVLKNLESRFMGKFKFFSLEQLCYVLKFYQYLPDFDDASRISYLIGWDHLIVLLSLPDFNDAFHYIAVINRKGLDAQELQNLISNDLRKNVQFKKNGSRKLYFSQLFTDEKSTLDINRSVVLSLRNFRLFGETPICMDITSNKQFMKFIDG